MDIILYFQNPTWHYARASLCTRESLSTASTLIQAMESRMPPPPPEAPLAPEKMEDEKSSV